CAATSNAGSRASPTGSSASVLSPLETTNSPTAMHPSAPPPACAGG
ncbi:MAG: hypothetical protein AVDCRST_MAG49-2407, partial [uncultured Thermomicrobiales bacterium]